MECHDWDNSSLTSFLLISSLPVPWNSCQHDIQCVIKCLACQSAGFRKDCKCLWSFEGVKLILFGSRRVQFAYLAIPDILFRIFSWRVCVLVCKLICLHLFYYKYWKTWPMEKCRKETFSVNLGIQTYWVMSRQFFVQEICW